MYWVKAGVITKVFFDVVGVGLTAVIFGISFVITFLTPEVREV
jgi:hypothetical protein